jgi:hypothetical protein
MYFSLLENGHFAPGLLPIGSYVTTQWGQRKVVAHVLVPLPQSEPTTTWGAEA